jgi:hypothetical protein
VNIVERLKKINGIDRFYASTLTLVELYSVVSRNIQSYKLPSGIEEIANHRIKLRLTIAFFFNFFQSIYFQMRLS